MNLVILVLFLLISIIHLYQSFHDLRKERAKTKPFLLITLLLFYLLSSKVKDIFLILALAFSWLGDVLLIFPGNRMFLAGGVLFSDCPFLFHHSFYGTNPLIAFLSASATHRYPIFSYLCESHADDPE